MSEALAMRGGNDLTREQIELLKRTIAKGATDDELRLFEQTCNRLQLDPFARQIYLVKRWDKDAGREVAQTQVSIDGLRLTAQRSAGYRGQTAPQWCGPDGVWVDVWLQNKPPAAARVGVHRAGFIEPLVRVARFDSYAQKKKDGSLTKMWATMPDVMIAKCAEALALRAAFPAELSGAYTPEEMGAADAIAEVVSETRQPVAALPAPKRTEIVDPSTGEVHERPPPDRLSDCSTLEMMLAWMRVRARPGWRPKDAAVSKQLDRMQVPEAERAAVLRMIEDVLVPAPSEPDADDYADNEPDAEAMAGAHD
jgi:phage recombination protein Bet